MSEPSANDYDRVQYPSHALPQADPRRLETLGVLHGLKPAPARQCRVLEVGCGTGMNLLALASFLPDSEFVGVDLATEPIRMGRANLAELGLTNLTLHADDIRHIDQSWGTFDYILAHGVYSWVPTEVRDGLLKLCGQNLAPHGIAYVSYNTLPGGYLRRMIRDMLLVHVRQVSDPDSRLAQARDLLDFLVQGIGADDADAAAVRAEAERTAHHVDALLYHDDLAEFNQPVYFHEFVAHARRFGLDYLVEADFNEGQELELPAEVQQQLDRLDPIMRVQYLDFLKCRRFRQTLLCRQEVERRAVEPAQLKQLWIASDMRATDTNYDLGPEATQEFVSSSGATLTSRDPAIKAAMRVLEQCWPAEVTFTDLVERAFATLADTGNAAVVEAELARVLLQGYATGLIELSVEPLAAGHEPHRGPCAPPLVRWQLARGEPVTTLSLRSFVIDDEETRQVLAHADGSRTLAEMARELEGIAVEPQVLRLARLSLLFPLPPSQSR